MYCVTTHHYHLSPAISSFLLVLLVDSYVFLSSSLVLLLVSPVISISVVFVAIISLLRVEDSPNPYVIYHWIYRDGSFCVTGYWPLLTFR